MPRRLHLAGTYRGMAAPGVTRLTRGAGRPRRAPSAISGHPIPRVITLLLVPVFYSISVLDLKIVKWEPGKHQTRAMEGVPCSGIPVSGG